MSGARTYRLTVTDRGGRVLETMEGAYGPLVLKQRIDAALAIWGDGVLTVAALADDTQVAVPAKPGDGA